jgi:hypothetical protein
MTCFEVEARFRLHLTVRDKTPDQGSKYLSENRWLCGKPLFKSFESSTASVLGKDNKHDFRAEMETLPVDM